jgi:DNA-binding XRE family transcriptional regulator
MHTKGMDSKIDIKKLREDMDLTQAKFAERLGLDRTSVVHIEKGRAPRKAMRPVIERLRSETPHKKKADKEKSSDKVSA